MEMQLTLGVMYMNRWRCYLHPEILIVYLYHSYMFSLMQSFLQSFLNISLQPAVNIIL